MMRSLAFLAVLQAGHFAVAAPAVPTSSSSQVEKRRFDTVEAFESDFYHHLLARDADESKTVETCLRLTLPDPEFHRGLRTPSIVEIIPCPSAHKHKANHHSTDEHDKHGKPAHHNNGAKAASHSSDSASIDDICAARAVARAAAKLGGSSAAKSSSSGGHTNSGGGGGSGGGKSGSTGSSGSGNTGNNGKSGVNNGQGTNNPPANNNNNSCNTGTAAQIAACLGATVNLPGGTTASQSTQGTPTQSQSSASSTATGVNCSLPANVNLAICLGATIGGI